MLFPPGRRVNEKAKKNAERLLKYYKEMGYQNCCVSSLDLGAGVQFLRKHDYSGSLFLSVNIKKDGKEVFQKGRLYNIKGLKIVVFAITDRPPINLPKGVSISQPDSAMKGLLPAIKGKADIVIMLTSMDINKTRSLLKNHPDIDLVISSGAQVPTYVPIKAGKTLIVSSHPKGKSVGIIALNVEKGRVKNYDNKLIMLRDSALNSF